MRWRTYGRDVLDGGGLFIADWVAECVTTAGGRGCSLCVGVCEKLIL